MAILLFLSSVFQVHYHSASYSEVKILDRSSFDFVDFLTNSIGMPIGALLISIFAGYYYTKDFSRKELDSSSLMFNIWYILIRNVSPIAILIILIQGILPLFK
ncbi:hypothetical protein [Lysinibacillus xylanilyticus]|uniref:hypothetical protein n=1 Tax=Lysinibacillus xylanilyticus TaxID=582475 RepID=UPI0037F664D8